MIVDPEMLASLSIAELEALAEGAMVHARQARLEELLAQNNESSLTSGERRELARLLELSDQLTILKARARYTLGRLGCDASV